MCELSVCFFFVIRKKQKEWYTVTVSPAGAPLGTKQFEAHIQNLKNLWIIKKIWAWFADLFAQVEELP